MDSLRFLMLAGTVAGLELASKPAAISQNALALGWRRDALKQDLLKVCAGCGRGFGASASDRRNVAAKIAELGESACPDVVATAGIEGGDSMSRWMGRGFDLRYDDPSSAEADDLQQPRAPLGGRWRLVYTSAADVLGLDTSPFVAIGDIYQDIEVGEPSTVTNVITLFPRLGALVPALDVTPSGGRSTVATLRVGTRARARNETRVGLTFESVSFDAQSLLGVDVATLLPKLSAPLLRLPGSGGADSEASPSYFDVLFVDHDMLIIQQNAPGGVFVAVRA